MNDSKLCKQTRFATSEAVPAEPIRSVLGILTQLVPHHILSVRNRYDHVRRNGKWNLKSSKICGVTSKDWRYLVTYF